MDKNITVAITVYGKVQGVGFRPLVCRLAKKFRLTGFVKNAGTHVEIIATGVAKNIEKLCDSLKQASKPVRVEEITCKEITLQPFATFVSVASTEANEVRCVAADIGICEDCLRELHEKQNRRNGYSYISCARCGPRYTIIRKLPYDRNNTTMDTYALCDGCAAEYNNMEDRRGHGETISCYHCGPQLQCFVKEEYKSFLPSDSVKADYKREDRATTHKKTFVASEPKTTPFENDLNNNLKNNRESAGKSSDFSDRRSQDRISMGIARELLTQGQIIMVKAVGGFNLLCRADRSEPVMRLRDLKKRMSKPFAVMVKRAEDAESFCFVSPEEKKLLESEARPIVLLQKCDNAAHIAPNVTDVSGQVGVFLPSMGFYAALDVPFPVIVTSCNYTGEPILYKDAEAFRFFEAHEAIAALFTYDREILRPADDAVARIVNEGIADYVSGKSGQQKLPEKDGEFSEQRHKRQIIRRTKGYMPEAAVTGSLGGNVLATGAEMKPGFCLTADGQFFPAEIPGDITLERTERFFEESVQDWMRLLNIRPEAVVADLHPGYATTQWGKQFAEQNGLPFYQAQHHHAHALAVMAEHGLQGKTLAVCFDGTGLGADGTVWGGEFLLCEGADYKRIGHLKQVSLLGGDASMQQAWKTALCHLAAAGIASPDSRYAVVKAALQQKINCIETSSMGRLFDAAASILGLADFNSHEGRCAMALEAAARKALIKKAQPLPLAFTKEKTAPDENSNCSNTSCKEVSNINNNTKNNWKKAVYNPAPLWETLLQVPKEQKQICAAALGFHYAICDMVVDMAETAGIRQIVLAGGCFANRILLETCTNELRKRGFLVYYNEKVSPGDGGIAPGQAYYGLLKSNGTDR